MILLEKKYYELDTIASLKKVSSNKKEKQDSAKLEEQTYHAQKMESLGTLAGGMAHDMNNVLASIMAVASAMDAEMSSDNPYADDVKDILNACKRGSNLTKSLLGFARRQRMNISNISLNTTATEVVNILSRTASKGIDFVLNLDEKLRNTTADPDQLSHIIMNICINAIDAMGTKGTLTIETQNTVRDGSSLGHNTSISPGAFSQIRVSDTGPGIPQDIQDKVFEPFFTTKPKGKGTGLGLAMAYGIIKKHKGLIRIDSKIGKGTSVIIELPSNMAAATETPEYSGKIFSLPKGKTGTILLVDDEDLFRVSSKRILEKLGYSVVCAENGQEAVELFSQSNHKIDMVILDMIMPVMGGRETFYKLHEMDPTLPILIASGFTEEDSIKDILENGAIGFISKPFDLKSLSEALPSTDSQAPATV